MIKWIIFDFDGVIGDSFPVSVKIFDDVKTNHNLGTFNFLEVRNIGTREAMKKANITGFRLLRVLLLLKKIQKTYSKQLSNVPLFKGMREVIEELSKKYNLAILSSNTKKNIEFFLKKESLSDYFKFISDDHSMFGKDKVMKKLMRKYKFNSDEIIYIGDEDRDVISMKKLNISIISVTWGYNSLKYLEKINPNYLAKKPKSIISLIDLINKEK